MVHISQITEKNEVLVAWLRIFMCMVRMLTTYHLHVYGENVDNLPPSGQFPGREWNPDLPNMKQERHENIQSTRQLFNRGYTKQMSSLHPQALPRYLDEYPDIRNP
jgi:hypothetical protein